MSPHARQPAASAEPLPPEAVSRLEPMRLVRLSSSELLRGASEVLIEHEQQVYRLRRTAAGKLILTK